MVRPSQLRKSHNTRSPRTYGSSSRNRNPSQSSSETPQRSVGTTARNQLQSSSETPQRSVRSRDRSQSPSSAATSQSRESARPSTSNRVQRPSRRKSSTPRRINIPAERRTKILLIGTKRYKVNVTTLQTIRKLQLSTENCIPKKPFARLVKEIFQSEETPGNNLKVQSNALLALQLSSEMYLTHLFEDANLLAQHAKRITLMAPDIKLVLKLRGEFK